MGVKRGLRRRGFRGRREGRGFKSYSATRRRRLHRCGRQKRISRNWCASLHKRSSASPTSIGQITERSFSSRICSLPGDESLRKLQRSRTSLVYHLASFSFSIQTPHTHSLKHTLCVSLCYTHVHTDESGTTFFFIFFYLFF